MAVSDDSLSPVVPVRVAVEVRVPVPVPVLVLRFPVAGVPDVVLELMIEIKVVLRPTGMPGASDSKVAAGVCEVTTDGWVVTTDGWVVMAGVVTSRQWVGRSRRRGSWFE